MFCKSRAGPIFFRHCQKSISEIFIKDLSSFYSWNMRIFSFVKHMEMGESMAQNTALFLKGTSSLVFCYCLFVICWETHYWRPDGDIPHDQTNQSPLRGTGATQPCSSTPFHSLPDTNTWSPINGALRSSRGGGSLESCWSMPADFTIPHHFIHWRIQTSTLITSTGSAPRCAC